jgi:ABC-type uncharacterized transport system ATPase subunit
VNQLYHRSLPVRQQLRNFTGKTCPDNGVALLAKPLDLTQMSEVVIAQSGWAAVPAPQYSRRSAFENLELAQKTNKPVGPARQIDWRATRPH